MTPIVETPVPSAHPSGDPSAGPLHRAGADTLAPRWLVLVLVLFVSTFAFLLASFPARNSDVWKHLAAGRDVARGQLPLDNTAFADTGAGSTWLYDLVCYGVYSVAGGTGLV